MYNTVASRSNLQNYVAAAAAQITPGTLPNYATAVAGYADSFAFLIRLERFLMETLSLLESARDSKMFPVI